MRNPYPKARRYPQSGVYGSRYKFTILELPYVRGWYWCWNLHSKKSRRQGDGSSDVIHFTPTHKG